ncbi:hypothetical protein B6N60_04912 [Richelia sinica FACHB-800]|nr:hypothetical protein [Richelia sinica]MBD2666914.1 hypothetical protein [Richelia sinica FACHB-800]QXE26181.1 hypothetical protein B6N60_04912 [Richelia sinica FACHB-800]
MQVDTSFGFNYSRESTSEESLERLEEQCDRETEEFLWGAYKFEQVDCPESDVSDEELDMEDNDDNDNFDNDDFDD